MLRLIRLKDTDDDVLALNINKVDFCAENLSIL